MLKSRFVHCRAPSHLGFNTFGRVAERASLVAAWSEGSIFLTMIDVVIDIEARKEVDQVW